MIAADALLIATLVMSMISMVLSCMALWPQCKDSLVVVRDGVLWLALVAVIVGAATMAWRYHGAGQSAVNDSGTPWADTPESPAFPVAVER